MTELSLPTQTVATCIGGVGWSLDARFLFRAIDIQIISTALIFYLVESHQVKFTRTLLVFQSNNRCYQCWKSRRKGNRGRTLNQESIVWRQQPAIDGKLQVTIILAHFKLSVARQQVQTFTQTYELIRQGPLPVTTCLTFVHRTRMNRTLSHSI